MNLRIKIISPLKATQEDLARRQRRYASHATPTTAVTVFNLEGGPAALNSGGDVLLSAAAIFQEGKMTSGDEFDAILIDCVFDPSVDELVEATQLPTFGPTRTTLPFISMVASSFSIIARTRRQCELLAELVEAEGYGDQLQSLRALDISYDEAKQETIFHRVMLDRLQEAVVQDGARAIMFGSTTMALSEEMRLQSRGVPLFMPGMVALRTIEHLWQDGLWPRKVSVGKE